MQRRNSRMIARIRKHTTLQMSGKKCVHSPPPPPPPPPLIIIVIIIIIRSLMSLGGVVTGDGHYNVRDCGEQK